tara:strand:+ start:303 stop:452 length:150 start_codon:yes stop_codon:yes gene_type:complete
LIEQQKLSKKLAEKPIEVIKVIDSKVKSPKQLDQHVKALNLEILPDIPK